VVRQLATAAFLIGCAHEVDLSEIDVDISTSRIQGVEPIVSTRDEADLRSQLFATSKFAGTRVTVRLARGSAPFDDAVVRFDGIAIPYANLGGDWGHAAVWSGPVPDRAGRLTIEVKGSAASIEIAPPPAVDIKPAVGDSVHSRRSWSRAGPPASLAFVRRRISEACSSSPAEPAWNRAAPRSTMAL
jgi:hypothetical protein